MSPVEGKGQRLEVQKVLGRRTDTDTPSSENGREFPGETRNSWVTQKAQLCCMILNL